MDLKVYKFENSTKLNEMIDERMKISIHVSLKDWHVTRIGKKRNDNRKVE